MGEGHESEMGPADLGRHTGDASGVLRHGAEIRPDVAAALASCASVVGETARALSTLGGRIAGDNLP